MPKYNSVKDLKTLALECVSKYVLDVALIMKKDFNGSHKYFTEKLPASIRTDILACTYKLLEEGAMRPCDFRENSFSTDSSLIWNLYTRKTNLGLWNGIINAMLDPGVYRLPCLYFYKSMDEELFELDSILNRNGSNLQNLSVEFVDLSESSSSHHNMLDTIQHSLKNYLAPKLGKLVLPEICNIAMLKNIGTKSLYLKHLDLINSPCVQRMGIRYLLLKDSRLMENTELTDNELCHMLNELNNNKEMLNPCCWTIEELFVTKSKECYASLLMILSCVKTLKSVGSSMEFGLFEKSVGDAIVTIWKNSPKPRIFELTVLCDRNLTIDKLVVFGECLPYVENVTTNFSSLVVSEQTSLFWSRVKTLYIEPRPLLNGLHFHEFMNLYGPNLVHLAFNDNDMYDVDVEVLVTFCPNLETVQGKLHFFDPTVGQFSKLQRVYLVNPNVDTCNWFFENCPCLEELKIHTDGNQSLINYIIKDPPLFVRNSLKRLHISFYSIVSLTPSTIIQFIIKCTNLKELGVLCSWNSKHDFTKQIKKFVQKKNYDLSVF